MYQIQGSALCLLALLACLIDAQPMNCTTPAKSLPELRALINNASDSLISPRMKGFIVDVLLDESFSKILAGECVNQNNQNVPNATVQAQDEDWMVHFNNVSGLGLNADQNATLHSTAAQYLHTVSDRYGAAIAQAFVADAQGVLVGASYLTPDLWQGDEPKWSDAFNSCDTGVHIAPKQLDADAQNDYVQFIGLPVISSQNVAVGAIAWGLRESSLPCTANGPSLAMLANWIRRSALDNETQEFVIQALLPYSADPFLADAVRAVNDQQLPLNVLLDRNTTWRIGFDTSNFSDPVFNLTTNLPQSSYLDHVIDLYEDDRWISDVVLRDIQGQIVAVSEIVEENYFAGDEIGFQAAFNNCSGGFFIDDLKLDEVFIQWGRRVVLPVLDAENKLLGTLAWFLGAPGEPSSLSASFLDVSDLVKSNSVLSERTRAFVSDRLLPYVVDDTLVEAAEESNKIGEPLSATLLDDFDWLGARANGNHSSVELAVLASEATEYLKEQHKELGLGAVLSCFVTDYRGRVIAMDPPTNDYYQGDEPGHIGAVNGGAGGLYVDPFSPDPVSGVTSQLVSLPLISAENRVVGALTFVLAVNALQCQVHATLFHELVRQITALPQPPDVLKSWYIRHLVPEIFNSVYEDDAEASYEASFSLAQLAQTEKDWLTNSSVREAVTMTSSALALKALQANFPPLANAWIQGIRGEVVGAIVPPLHYWGINETMFVQSFSECNGSVYAPSTGFDFDDNPLRFFLSLPIIEDDNTVRGTVTFVVEWPHSQSVSVIRAFPGIALALSILTTLAAIGFGAVFYQYRSTNLVKMSSPAFLLVSLAGAIATSWGLFALVTQPLEDASSVCYARTFIVPLGFVLFFSPLFMKSYRVYRIFEATLGAAPQKKFKSAKFRNKYVFVRVGIFMGIQLAICVLGMILPNRPDYQEELDIDPETLQRTFTFQCSQNSVFLSLTLIYNLVLLVFGAIISVLGRRYPTAFNESIFIMITINLLASFSIIILFGNALPDVQTVAWLNSIGGHLMLWVAMGLLFGVKVFLIVTGHADDKVTLVIAPTAEKKNSSSGSTTPATKDSKKPTAVELPVSKAASLLSRSETSTAASPESHLRHLPLHDPVEPTSVINAIEPTAVSPELHSRHLPLPDREPTSVITVSEWTAVSPESQSRHLPLPDREPTSVITASESTAISPESHSRHLPLPDPADREPTSVITAIEPHGA